MAFVSTLAVPLYERPAVHVVSVEQLRSWRYAAHVKAERLGKGRGLAEGELHRDLDLYMRYLVDRDGRHWEQQQPQAKVRLRMSLEEMEEGWTSRVEKRKPIEYVVGCVAWRNFLLNVQEGVLIPRVETEQFVDLAREAIFSHPSLRHGIWADLGTGSGAIAVGLGHLLGPNGGPVIAVDCMETPLAVARSNVRRYQLQESVKVVRGSWFSPFQDQMGQLAGVLSNPPYVPSGRIPNMRAEACKHEPEFAMNGGREGTDHLKLVCDGALEALRPGGFLALETDGGTQAHKVADYLGQGKFTQVTVVKDYAGIDRFVTAYTAK